MESLALVVEIELLIALLGGPIAIGITWIKTESNSLRAVRRIFHGIFVILSLGVAIMFFINLGLQMAPGLIGLYTLTTGYIAIQREYFRS